TSQCEVVSHKPVQTHARLQVKLECAAEVRMTDTGCRDSSPGIQKRNPAGPSRKVVAQMRRKSHYPLGAWRVLATAKQLDSPLEVATIPMALAEHRPQHVAIHQAEQSQVVSLGTPEGL